jgi:hypothetical protein
MALRMTDPTTGKTIDWSSGCKSSSFAMPLTDCTDDKSLASKTMPWECPNTTALLGSHIYVIGKTWQVQEAGVWQFDSTSFAYLNFFGFPIGNNAGLVNALIGATHLGTSIHANAGANQVEAVVSISPQGPDALHLLTLTDAGVLTDLGALNYQSLTAGGSAYSTAYMPKSALMADGTTRIIGAAFLMADATCDACLLTNSSWATTGWASRPFITGGSTMIQQIAVSGTKIFVVFGTVYGGTRLGAAYYDGSAWWYLTPSGKVSVPAGGMTQAAYDAASYWLPNTAADLICGRQAIFTDANNVWVSAINFTSSANYPYNNLTGNSRHYLWHFNLAATGAAVVNGPYGPLFSAPSGWHSGMDLQLDGTLLRVLRSIPQTGTNLAPNINDYPHGAPTFGVYHIDPSATTALTNAPSSVPIQINTLGLDGTGSAVDYTDADWSDCPAHDQGFGDHQQIFSATFVPGTSGVVAELVSDRRATGVHPVFAFNRLKVVQS